jgi:hypothetical protein
MQLLTVLTTRFIQIIPRGAIQDQISDKTFAALELTPAPQSHSESSLMGGLHPTSISYSAYSFIHFAT